MNHKRLRERMHFTLKRDLGLPSAVAAGVGIMVGAGIYVLIGAASGMAGNALWISFLLGALVAVFTGLSYAELSSMFPKDSGEYIYTAHAFGRKLAFIVGYSVFLGGLIAAATVSLGFAGYFSKLLNIENSFFLALVLIVLMSLINFCGIKQSAKINIALTLIQIGALIFIIISASRFFGTVNYMEMSNGLKGVFEATSLIFFAYIGFEAVIKLAEETKNPKRTIPVAIVLSVIITTIIYCLVAISAVSVIDWRLLSKSTSPLADIANALLGSKAFIFVATTALLSTLTTVLIDLIATSRILYGISHEFKKLNFITKIHPKTRTPWVAVFLTMFLAIPFIFLEEIHLVAEITNFSIFVTFFLVNSSLIWLRYKEPDAKRSFRIPLNIGKFPLIAFFGALSCIFLILNLSIKAMILGVALFIAGYLIYLILEKFEKAKSF